MSAEIKPIKEYKVFDDIMSFLYSKDIASSSGNSKYQTKDAPMVSNTRKNYTGDIKQFFRILKEKEIEYLSESDLTITKSDLTGFIKYLQSKGLVNKTIKRKLASLKMLYKYLSYDYKEFIDLSVFDSVGKLKTVEKNWGRTNKEEADLIAEDMYINERQKPLLKKLCVKAAARTSFRLSALLRIRWSDFEIDSATEHYVVSVLDKGSKVVSTGINKSFYEELLELKNKNTVDTDYVFKGLSEQSLRHSLKRSKERLGIPPERDLKFHSFKGVGIDYVYEHTGHDILAAREQGNHSSVSTTERYMSKRNDISKTAGVIMDEEIEINKLYEAKKEDFVSFFEKAEPAILNKFIKFLSESNGF
ncbi:site-specific integrase [Bacillus nakamurai]|uniref:Integrase n=1 Tax=Bacillus nakamurai TaxID=1793963 RepID=A0A150FAN1_9BACI|nr:site-specific integrase [Bacillus nakamurai]KXZ22369.1 integrase [Bacillus nakamurai]MED1228406.1 site-specific integrase [Bacillus nakamurai]